MRDGVGASIPRNRPPDCAGCKIEICIGLLKPISATDLLASCGLFWEKGMWLGIRDEKAEIIIGTDSGAIKARDFKRIADKTERWNKGR